MMSMPRRAMIMMALFLAAATTAAAATAFAGEADLRKKTGQQVAAAVHVSQDAALKAKILAAKPVRLIPPTVKSVKR
jgi:hypothetical protein